MLWPRRRRTLPEELEPDKFTMTPMIDITFQLIIFFMLVMDMSRAQVEELTIPPASMAVTDRLEPELIVNVMPDGRVRVAGRTFDDGALEDLFEVRKRNAAQAEMPLLIRADRSVPFETVQKVMMIASYHGQVTRLRFGARKE